MSGRKTISHDALSGLYMWESSTSVRGSHCQKQQMPHWNICWQTDYFNQYTWPSNASNYCSQNLSYGVNQNPLSLLRQRLWLDYTGLHGLFTAKHTEASPWYWSCEGMWPAGTSVTWYFSLSALLLTIPVRSEWSCLWPWSSLSLSLSPTPPLYFYSAGGAALSLGWRALHWRTAASSCSSKILAAPLFLKGDVTKSSERRVIS